MTEAEWLTCEDLGRLLRFRARNRTERKQRLWACACCRLVSYLMIEAGKRAIEVAERYADGEASSAELETAQSELLQEGFSEGPEGPAVALLSANVREVVAEVAWSVPATEASAVEISLEAQGPEWESAFGTPDQAREEVTRKCVAFLRDIFGNPFRKVKFNRKWRTSNAVALARQMYESRDFGAMPILADALQDAGCDSEDVLSHCRDANAAHVRGCWVVDLVLGKE